MGSQVFRALAVAVVLLAACKEERRPSAAPAADLRYDGATTISNRILVEAVPAFRERTGVTVRVDRSGTGIGLRRLQAGEVDVAGVSRSLTPDELARKPHVQIVGYDALGVFVQDANPIRALTKAQVKAVFTGAVRSWKALGGADLPIRPCTERRDSKRATLEALQMLALDGEPYGEVKELEDPTDCLAWIAATPGGVTAATTTYRIPRVRPVAVNGVEPTPANIRSSRYLLTRPLLLVSREPPQGALARFFEFAVSPEGQAIVAKAGLVPAR